MPKRKITVTSPQLPPLNEFIPYLENIWKNKWITNDGEYHKKLEEELCEYLGVEYISLTANGTLALIIALQALRISGEVITTPYSFVASTHSVWWNNTQPVFVDIEPDSFNIDPNKIEAAITPKTSAILPVHVYGRPCNVEAIKNIADTYNLKVIYDAAHAFGVKVNNRSIMSFGDLSILSFHATKVYNTIEGGAIVCKSAEMKRHIDDLKDFGFRDEVTVVAPGINAKMNEVQAAYGLINLKYVGEGIKKRKGLAKLYNKKLKYISGLVLKDYKQDEADYNYGYYPVCIKSDALISRDELYQRLKENGILARKYFYPLISNLPTYRGLSSSSKNNLPYANIASSSILCLPLFADMQSEDVEYICDVVKSYF